MGLDLEQDSRAQFIGTTKGEQFLPDGKKIADGSPVFVSLETRWNKGSLISGPLPSHIALFLNTSVRSYNDALRIKDNFVFKGSNDSFSGFTSSFYDYLEHFFSSIVFAITTIEAFCNLHITKETQFTRKDKKYSGEEIERWISLDEKLTEIVAKELGVKINKAIAVWSNYKDLLRMRDRLIHLKNKDRESSDPTSDTIWKFSAIESTITPPKVTIELLKLFYSNTSQPKWLMAAEKSM